MCKRKPWDGLERWRRLYMFWFCQIPLSLGSSCYRPNSRGPLLLLVPFSSSPTVPCISDFFSWRRSAVATIKPGCGLRLSSLFNLPSSPASIPQLTWAADWEEELVDSRTICLLGIPASCFSLPFPPPKQCIQPHSLAFSRWVDTSSDRSRVRHGGHCATGVLHGYAPEI